MRRLNCFRDSQIGATLDPQSNSRPLAPRRRALDQWQRRQVTSSVQARGVVYTINHLGWGSSVLYDAFRTSFKLLTSRPLPPPPSSSAASHSSLNAPELRCYFIPHQAERGAAWRGVVRLQSKFSSIVPVGLVRDTARPSLYTSQRTYNENAAAQARLGSVSVSRPPGR